MTHEQPDSEAGPGDDYTLRIQSVGAAPLNEEGNVLRLLLKTTRGDIRGVFHVVEGGTDAVIFVCGAMGGLDGPADRLWPRIAGNLAAHRISSLRLDYRQPNEFTECVLDVLGGVSFLKGIGAGQVVLVGHSFGGAVVIRAAGLAPIVSAVASLSSQLYGTSEVDSIGRPLLLVHGAMDTILSHEASEDIYRRASEPKQLVLYAGTGHALTEAAVDVEELLEGWIRDRMAGIPSESGRLESEPQSS